MSNDESFIPPEETSGRILPPWISLWTLILGPLLWISLVLSIFLGLPRIAKIFDDFGVQISPLVTFVLSHADIILLIVIMPVGLILFTSRSRTTWTILAIVVPFLLLLSLVICIAPVSLRLINDLAEAKLP